jgi:hypothetical protein
VVTYITIDTIRPTIFPTHNTSVLSHFQIENIERQYIFDVLYKLKIKIIVFTHLFSWERNIAGIFLAGHLKGNLRI